MREVDPAAVGNVWGAGGNDLLGDCHFLRAWRAAEEQLVGARDAYGLIIGDIANESLCEMAGLVLHPGVDQEQQGRRRDGAGDALLGGGSGGGGGEQIGVTVALPASRLHVQRTAADG